MDLDADLASPAGVIADPTRAAMLLALMEGRALPASELARRAGASPSLASAHLRRLREGGLVEMERDGRRRLYRLAGREVAEALEGLARIAPARQARGLREHSRAEHIREARTCYDHLAGRLGVSLADSLCAGGVLEQVGAGYRVTEPGRARLQEVGIDLAELESRKRPLTRVCVDWTERRPHVAGGLGAALADHAMEMGWVRRRDGGRALKVTPTGRLGFDRAFGVEL